MNTNVLEGMRCPECGSFGPYSIAATALFVNVTDEGTDEYTDVEWNSTSLCICVECNHVGPVSEYDDAFMKWEAARLNEAKL